MIPRKWHCDRVKRQGALPRARPPSMTAGRGPSLIEGSAGYPIATDFTSQVAWCLLSMPAAARVRMPSIAWNAVPGNSALQTLTVPLSNRESRGRDDAENSRSALFSIADAAVCGLFRTVARLHLGARRVQVGEKAAQSRIS